jgi:hypothetical protein
MTVQAAEPPHAGLGRVEDVIFPLVHLNPSAR